MSIPIASEKSLLSQEEFEVVKATHRPAISGMSLEALESARSDLRERREKTRALVQDSRRRVRTKRGSSETSPGAKEPPAGRRKQVFAQALKRLNHELSRREAATARAVPSDAPRVPRTQRGTTTPPPAAPDAKRGTAQNPKRRRKLGGEEGEVKRASKTTKAGKAKRDA
jgi:hypothetical protein